MLHRRGIDGGDASARGRVEIWAAREGVSANGGEAGRERHGDEGGAIPESAIANGEINGNIHQGSFLEDGLISKINSHLERGQGWPVKFDVIMGNPPYNKGGVAKGGGVFWVEFK